MPAHRVVKAAAVLIAASATVIPVAEAIATDPASTSFVEVLQGPDDQNEINPFGGSGNAGCEEH